MKHIRKITTIAILVVIAMTATLLNGCTVKEATEVKEDEEYMMTPIDGLFAFESGEALEFTMVDMEIGDGINVIYTFQDKYPSTLRVYNAQLVEIRYFMKPDDVITQKCDGKEDEVTLYPAINDVPYIVVVFRTKNVIKMTEFYITHEENN